MTSPTYFDITRRDAIEQVACEIVAGLNVQSLAEKFGVHHSTISRIARREWRKEVA
jgi:IS30 family transposase